MSDSSGSLVGQTIGHYAVTGRLGEGGMGVVYLAHDSRLNRDVAIKMVAPAEGNDPALAKRLIREARAASALNHPNIVTIHDIAEADGREYIVMERVQGRSLAELIPSEGLGMGQVLDIGTQIADAVAAAHAAHIVHRDLKPGNVMVTPGGRVKILDFGLARFHVPAVVDDSAPTMEMPSQLTRARTILGTVGYMSPEQIEGQEAHEPSDVFSLGIILYEMLTGRRPFRGDSDWAIVAATIQCAPQPLRPDTPGEVARIVANCLQRRPEDRYPSAVALAADLHALAEGRISLSAVKPAAAKRVRPWVAAAGMAGLLLVATVLYMGRGTHPKAPVSAGGLTAIVVLPFVNMSADKDQEYFSDGLSEELLTALSRNPKLKVTSRTSAFSFKGKEADIKTIADKLHVTHVLEGSVRKAGSQLRITAQLIEAASDSRLWSQTYDRRMENIFAVQEDIAASVAGALKATLEGAQRSTAQRTTPEAYNAYLQGRYFYARRSKEDFEKAANYFEKALKIDSTYAPAWSGLSSTHSFQADWGQVPLAKGYAMAREEVERALALDPNLADAYAQLGWIKTSHDWDWAGADSAYKRALELGPGDASVIQSAAWLAGTLGRKQEALRLCRRAIEMDPLLIAAYNNLGIQAYNAGQWDESEAAFRHALALNPLFPGAHGYLGLIYLVRSRTKEALAEIRQESQEWRRTYGLALAFHAAGNREQADAALAEFSEKYGEVGAFQAAEIHAYRGEADKAFEWLDRAYKQRDGGLADIKGDPLLRNVEKDERYRAFLQKLKLPLD